MIRLPNPIPSYQPGLDPGVRASLQNSRLNYFLGVRPTDNPMQSVHPAVQAYMKLLQSRGR